MKKSNHSKRHNQFSHKRNATLENEAAPLVESIMILKTLGRHLYERGDVYGLELVWNALQALKPARKRVLDELREMKGLEPYEETLDGLWHDME